MITEIKIPSPGESINEVEIGRWLAEDGSIVSKGQEIAEVESDKATLTIVAQESGKLKILAEEGQTMPVGAIACTIDTEFSTEPANDETGNPAEKPLPVVEKSGREEEKPMLPTETGKIKITSVAKEMIKENGMSLDEILSGLKRLGKKEIEAVLNLPPAVSVQAESVQTISRKIRREKMSPLRRKLSERLVSVKNETAMLTTFNEVDMKPIMDLRQKYQQKFTEKYGLKLGFMSFFTKAVAIAAQSYPIVNSMIDGDEILTPSFVDVGIAVSTPKGLMVPVVRNAGAKSIPEIEIEIKELAEKARTKKITVDELAGGTFTITNGGVFGSMLSTPIINPPQSAILGMHNIVDRPVAVDGQVVIRPVMYVALSYDHRIIDGKDSVGFLVKVKQLLEKPETMLTEGKDPVELLLKI